LLQKMIVEDPKERIEWGDVFHHALFNKFKSVVNDEFKKNKGKYPNHKASCACNIL